MISALGYLSYALITGFSPLQLLFMRLKRNVDLGAIPLVSLVAGLALLQLTFFYVTVPAYVIVGNAAGLVFAAINLAVVLQQRAAAPAEAEPENPIFLTLANGEILRAFPVTQEEVQAETERAAVWMRNHPDKAAQRLRLEQEYLQSRIPSFFAAQPPAAESPTLSPEARKRIWEDVAQGMDEMRERVSKSIADYGKPQG